MIAGVQAPVYVKHVVLLPVGPHLPRAYVLDTLETIRHYTDPDRRIIILRNRRRGRRLELKGPDLDLLDNPFGPGKKGILHRALCWGMRYALERYRFEVLLRMDDDTLIVGNRPEDDAIVFFRHHPGVGMLGSCRFTCMGYLRDCSWPAKRLRREMNDRAMMSEARSETGRRLRLAKARMLRNLHRRARRNGYQDGEHCLGAAYYLSHRCVSRLDELGLLDIPELGCSWLAEDHLMGLQLKAAGMTAAEFEQGDDPLCLDWLRLPCAPAELVRRGKKITHSVKRWNGMSQRDIRRYFREIRRSAA